MTTVESFSPSSAGPRSKTSFLTLPRELRDQIYEYVLGCRSPIPGPLPSDGWYCSVHTTHDIEDAVLGKGNLGSSISLAASHDEIRPEASHLFYGRHVFIVWAHGVKDLLASGNKVEQDDDVHRKGAEQWIRSLVIKHQFIDDGEYLIRTKSMDSLLESPSLQTVVVALTNRIKHHAERFDEFDILTPILDAYRQLNGKIGQGLVFKIELALYGEIRGTETGQCDGWCEELDFGWSGSFHDLQELSNSTKGKTPGGWIPNNILGGSFLLQNFIPYGGHMTVDPTDVSEHEAVSTQEDVAINRLDNTLVQIGLSNRAALPMVAPVSEQRAELLVKRARKKALALEEKGGTERTDRS